MSSSKVIQALVGASTVGIVIANALPNLLPDIIVKKRGLAVTPTDEITRTFKDVAASMSLNHAENVKVFINKGYGALCVGSPWLPGGAAIGLPRTVLFTSCEELENAGVTFQGKKLNWNSHIGRKMSEALLFDENELRFVLGHEIAHLKNNDFTTNCFLPAWWFYFTYRAVPILCGVLPPLNPILKLGSQTMIWIMSFLMFLHQNTKLSHNREFAADKMAATLDENSVQGGIHYILKKMKVNTLLRELNGDQGKKIYSKEGNDLKDWLHPDLLTRLRKLEDIYAECYLK